MVSEAKPGSVGTLGTSTGRLATVTRTDPVGPTAMRHRGHATMRSTLIALAVLAALTGCSSQPKCVVTPNDTVECGEG